MDFLSDLCAFSGKNSMQIVQSWHKPKPSVSLAWFTNQRKETARHEYFFPLS